MGMIDNILEFYESTKETKGKIFRVYIYNAQRWRVDMKFLILNEINFLIKMSIV